MTFQENCIYHIYNRGNQKQKIFFSAENYYFFIRKMRKEIMPHCTILAYCLMPNHFHLMVEIPEGSFSHRMTEGESPGTAGVAMHPLSKAIAILLRSYTRAIQKQEKFVGSLFQQKTKAIEITTEDYLQVCTNYIHRNPMKALLVNRMEEWEFSSFREYCGMDNGNLCNKQKLRNLLRLEEGDNFYDYSYSSLTEDDLVIR